MHRFQTFKHDIEASGRFDELLIVQEIGSSKKIFGKGFKIIKRMKKELSNSPRCDIDIKDLIIGIECGGSDATSGLASNPAAGGVADMVVREKGTVIVEEFQELIGCKDISCTHNSVHDRTWECCWICFKSCYQDYG